MIIWLLYIRLTLTLITLIDIDLDFEFKEGIINVPLLKFFWGHIWPYSSAFVNIHPGYIILI